MAQIMQTLFMEAVITVFLHIKYEPFYIVNVR